MREIRLLRATWRALETGLRKLLNGHEGGNAGHRQGASFGSPRQCSTLLRGAPQRGFSRLIIRIRSRVSFGTRGRPDRP